MSNCAEINASHIISGGHRNVTLFARGNYSCTFSSPFISSSPAQSLEKMVAVEKHSWFFCSGAVVSKPAAVIKKNFVLSKICEEIRQKRTASIRKRESLHLLLINCRHIVLNWKHSTRTPPRDSFSPPPWDDLRRVEIHTVCVFFFAPH